MNATTLYALAGGALGYFTAKSKRKRMGAALKYAAAGFAVATFAPRVGINLPIPSANVARAALATR